MKSGEKSCQEEGIVRAKVQKQEGVMCGACVWLSRSLQRKQHMAAEKHASLKVNMGKGFTGE